ncbi:MAG: pyruvate ferredoxin oxidoreductase [Archaeoglobi archaeon]|jgi:pyruvate ferredoxin oxidoreductase beta subunit|nr:thiamine pyrophosphate-dependent enzyme [Archaeoglobus sp.]NHW88336.1 pyruvate ferredoxin oxidoreductase [Archaeoglobales archaeon]TDA27810.1 MAG: pyruvate ferredoxin oxidoreductase [Archaeoglobi archaeon]
MRFFGRGHGACPGCGLAIAVRNILEALEGKCFVVNPTGCLEIISSQYGRNAWGVPYIHPLFDNAAAVACGISEALKVLGREDEGEVVVLAGDGATADIGLTLHGMFDRNHDVIYICLDNEAYQNTGHQQSALTPLGEATTTTPAGKLMLGKIGRKKDMVAIALAHGSPYVATSSAVLPADIRRKVKKAAKIEGAKYIQIHCPCVTGWGIDGKDVVKVGNLAIETALYPIVEFENGKLLTVRKVKERKPVEEYLKIQRRFRHLFTSPEGRKVIEEIQKIADENALRYGIDLKK